MSVRQKRYARQGALLLVLVVLGAGGCASPLMVRPVYQDEVTSIRLQTDGRTKSPHSHPAYMTLDKMQMILQGMRVVSRKGILGSVITGRAEERPAFSSIEVNDLAPRLSNALLQARPDELVTFYRRIADASVGLAITSGGLFVHGPHLYVILANHRTLPSEGMNQNMISEIDPIDSPLLPIVRAGFRAAFTPSLALVPPDERDPWPYVDEGRVVVIDLTQIDREMRISRPSLSTTQ